MIDWIIILQAGVAIGHGAAVRRHRRDPGRALRRAEPGRRRHDADRRDDGVQDGRRDRAVRGWACSSPCWRRARSACCTRVVTINFQADQVVSGLAINFVGVGLSLVLGEGLSKAGAIVAAADVHDAGALADPVPRPDPVHQPERAGLRRLPADAGGLVLHQPHAAGLAPARRGRVSGRCRRAGHQRLSAALPLRVRRRLAGRPGRRDDQPGRLAGLVQRADDRRARAGSPSAW